jgi:hypothetical protein
LTCSIEVAFEVLAGGNSDLEMRNGYPIFRDAGAYAIDTILLIWSTRSISVSLIAIHPATYPGTVEILFRKKVKVLAVVTCPSLFGDSLCQEALPDAPYGLQALQFIL